MNKYLRATVCVPFGTLKMGCTKVFHFKNFSGPLVSLVSPLAEITMDRGATLRIGNFFKMRDGAKIRVRKGAVCIIGSNSSMSSNNMIACRDRIEIGHDVQLSPNVQIYDHDHEFRSSGGLKDGKYNTAPIIIGNNVWIGANTVILRGSEIGDDSVIGAGSVIKGKYEAGSVIIQRRTEEVRKIL